MNVDICSQLPAAARVFVSDCIGPRFSLRSVPKGLSFGGKRDPPNAGWIRSKFRCQPEGPTRRGTTKFQRDSSYAKLKRHTIPFAERVGASRFCPPEASDQARE
ncbi:hypothetical protein PCASD_01985 [Puccinia coronata f. sp. avenae]|uniref:Uncharacterized protein n=1 Tax=Puccinia coronata f. sp. avenae TaxID=200324 RepID=A0A2N5VHI2_9BASI|nr:hypothetical protein PCASD_12612 [Puccinia coronata f. sp. avenae]PLW49463.1 hypothetical protein PCASD_01985 [Puccinia coronata f. sp. avenae]